MATLRCFMFVGLGLYLTGMAYGADERRPGDELMEKYLASDAYLLSQNELAGCTSREQWEAGRDELKKQYLDMLGLWPLPPKSELHAQVTGEIQRDSYRVEKVHFQSRPGLYVTGNLYLPNPQPREKLPAVLYVCGHSGRGRDGNKVAFQHHGAWFATHGYVCLIIDTLQLGEVAGIHHGTYNLDRGWWQAAGYTPAGVECWNGMRAIDYLVSRSEVDEKRIAVTGISGGGAATFWIAAADERVKVCVPVSGMSDLQSYVADKVVNGHCDCMFLYNTYRWEWTTIAALVAPRPMLFENSGYDPIFPMPANERIRERLDRLYGWYQSKPGELFDIGVTPGGHNDNVELRLMAYRWINKHLKNDNAEVNEPLISPIEGKELRVFPEDSDLPKDSINATVDESFVTLANPKPPTTPDEFAAWSKELRDALMERTFRPWPDEVSGAKLIEQQAPNRLLLATEDNLVVQVSKQPADRRAVKAERQSPADTASPDQKRRVWLLIVNPDEPSDRVPEWAKKIVGKDESIVLSPRGGGDLGWTRKNPPNYVERSHALLGRTVDGGRVWDVQSVARWMHEAEGGSELSIVVVGRGVAGVIGAYAAMLEPCIEEVVALDPPTSHRDGPILLNVLRVLDIPDAFGLLAPRRVTIETQAPEGFERTKLVFQAGGYADRLTIRKSGM